MQYKSQKYPHPVQGLYSPGLNTASFPNSAERITNLNNFFKGVFGKIATFSREFSLKKIRKDKRRRKPRIFSALAHCF